MSIVRKKVVLLHPQNDASVAQLVEHLTLNQGVQGSTPCGSTEAKAADFQRLLLFLSYHFLGHQSPFARPQIAQGNVADLHADEAKRGKTNGGGHVAHLSVLAFDEGEAHPTGGDGGAVANGGHALPKAFGWRDDLGVAWFGAIAFDDNAFFQLSHRFGRDLSVYLGEIGARMLKFRVQEPLDELAVVGQKQGTFTVVVEAASGVNSGRKTELFEGAVARFRGELAQYAKRLVEKDNHDINLTE